MLTRDYEVRTQAARRLGFASYHQRREHEARSRGFKSYYAMRKALGQDRPRRKRAA